jgi:hypothetical protein
VDNQDASLDGIDTSTPHPARRYNYLLGGTDNFPPTGRPVTNWLLGDVPRRRSLHDPRYSSSSHID